MATYKIIDIFGNEQTKIAQSKKKKHKNLFSDYDGFVDKFEAKKTTDDCYTPVDVFKVVLDFVAQNFDIDNKETIRPFYPNGDYQQIDYPKDCIVIDNPPFSIISKITRFYIDNDIKFFLFAPHLTLFSSNIKCTRLVVGADVVYENGAIVKTSFVSNIFGNAAVIGEPTLYKNLEQINKNKAEPKLKYEYPNNILTVSMVHALVFRGVGLKLTNEQVAFCRGLDSQKEHKKAIFGSGYLISDSAAAEKAAAEKADIIIWELSKKEKEIIKKLK